MKNSRRVRKYVLKVAAEILEAEIANGSTWLVSEGDPDDPSDDAVDVELRVKELRALVRRLRSERDKIKP